MSFTTEKLEKQIREANDAYRSGNPIMSDQEYDHLLDQLHVYSPKNELFSKGVIESTPTDRKRKLPIQMYSLDKTKDIDELKSWIKLKKLPNDIEVVITPKYDGISLCVHELNNQCWTRGDGEIGQLSNEHYKLIKHMSDEEYILTQKDSVYTFGEGIISKKDFEQFKDEYSAARNLVAGLFNKKEPTDKLKSVNYIRYGWENTLKINRKNELDYLNILNPIQVPYKVMSLSKLTENFLDNTYNLWSSDFEIDGLVVDINDYNIRQSLGRETNLNPAYSRAIKLSKWVKTVSTKVLDIEWNVGKNGILSPVLIVDQVDFNGVKINRVTGYNWRYLCDNHIAHNSIIEITRSGDVIPKHLNTLTWEETKYLKIVEMTYKSKCPSCGADLDVDDNDVNLFCSNDYDCPEQQIKKIIHFFKALEFDNVGEGELRNLYNEGFESVESIWNISVVELLQLNGWAQKSIDNFLNQIKKWNDSGIGIAKYLYALDLFNDSLGKKTIQKIIDDLSEKEIDEMSNTITGIRFGDSVRYPSFVNRLTTIDGIAEKSANSFIQGLVTFYKQDSYRTIINNVIWNKNLKTKIMNAKFDGFKVCFTGFRNKEMEATIVSGGGEIASGVSKNTTHLVVKDINSSSSKTIKAKELGIEIDDENSFKLKFM